MDMGPFFFGVLVGAGMLLFIYGNMQQRASEDYRDAVERIEQAAYENEFSSYMTGVEEGYGYAQQPWEEEYRQAGEHLRNAMGHKWPELDEEGD